MRSPWLRFAYKLARELGVFDVRSMLDSLTLDDFYMWQAFALLEPLEPDRADFRAGLVTSATYNVNRGKSTRPYKPSDFIPKYGVDPRKKPLTDVSQWKSLKATARSFAESGATKIRSSN